MNEVEEVFSGFRKADGQAADTTVDLEAEARAQQAEEAKMAAEREEMERLEAEQQENERQERER